MVIKANYTHFQNTVTQIKVWETEEVCGTEKKRMFFEKKENVSICATLVAHIDMIISTLSMKRNLRKDILQNVKN